MKSKIICVGMMFLASHLIAQSPFPFGESSATWTYWTNQGLGASTDLSQYTLFYSGQDTLINNQIYAILIEGRGSIKEGEENALFFLREENQKIFFFDSNEGEKLLYDFSDLKVGDSLFDKGFFNASEMDIVSKVDTITLSNGTPRKRYTIHEGYSYLIEGIGSNLELFPFTYQLAEYTAGIICHRINEEDIYINENSNFFNGECFLVSSLNDKLSPQTNVTIYPNPIKKSEGMNILLSPKILDGSELTGHIYAVSGEKIQQFIINNSKQNIRIKNIPNGLYFLTIHKRGYLAPITNHKIVVIE